MNPTKPKTFIIPVSTFLGFIYSNLLLYIKVKNKRSWESNQIDAVIIMYSGQIAEMCYKAFERNDEFPDELTQFIERMYIDDYFDLSIRIYDAFLQLMKTYLNDLLEVEYKSRLITRLESGDIYLTLIESDE